MLTHQQARRILHQLEDVAEQLDQAEQDAAQIRASNDEAVAPWLECAQKTGAPFELDWVCLGELREAFDALVSELTDAGLGERPMVEPVPAEQAAYASHQARSNVIPITPAEPLFSRKPKRRAR